MQHQVKLLRDTQTTPIPRRLVLKKTVFCVGEYAEYWFDQQRLIWFIFRLWDIVFS